MAVELIRLAGVSMRFGGEEVLKRIELSIMDREFLTLLGPSGCGKTTTLRIIGGFETPSAGDVFFGGERINDLPPYRRKVNTVFQKYALFTHLNVNDNVAFGLRIAKVPEAEVARRVAEALELVNLPNFGKRWVDEMSGGQQQRVAIARAIVNRPKVLLLDEPLGALDFKLRKDMQIELKRMQKQLGITFVYVTHDQEEALTMSDKISVMNRGTIQQYGTPTDIYNEPANPFVADFIGESNIVGGIMPADYELVMAGASFPCVDRGFEPGEEVSAVIRPEDIRLVGSDLAQMRGTVERVMFKGVHYEMMVAANGVRWKVHSTSSQPAGASVGLYISPGDIHIMKRTDDPNSLAMSDLASEFYAEEGERDEG